MTGRLIERRARRAAALARRVGRAVLLRAARLAEGPDRVVCRPGTIRRIVAARLDRLGDLVLTLPAIDGLVRAFPEARLAAVVRPSLASLLESRPTVDEVFPFPERKGLGDLARLLQALDADLLVDFSSSDETLVPRAAHRARIPIRVGHAGPGRGLFLTEAVPSPGHPSSLVEENSRLVVAAGGDACEETPRYVVPPFEKQAAQVILRQSGLNGRHPRIAVHPGGYYPSQRWPVNSFVEFIRAVHERYAAVSVLLGGPSETGILDRIAQSAGRAAVRAPVSDIRRLAAYLACCDFFVGNNSGPLHLASAVGLPTVSTLGPTDPVRFSPRGEGHRVLRLENLPCSPCTRGRCGPHDCLEGIGAEQVFRAAASLVEDPPAPAEKTDRRTGAS